MKKIPNIVALAFCFLVVSAMLYALSSMTEKREKEILDINRTIYPEMCVADNYHHRHNQGAHLSVVIDLRYPDIRNSNDAPGWVLVLKAQELGLNIEIKNSHPIDDRCSLLQVEVAIPVGVKLLDYTDGLKKIEFVVDVKFLSKGGNNE